MNLRRRATGFSLIEVLVAVLVVAVGVLGIAGLQLVTMRTNTGSLMRTQANQYAYNIIDRIRANPEADYAIAMGDDPPEAATDCEAAECTPEEMADFDRAGWLAELADLPSGDGEIEVDGDVVTVTLQWDDDNQADNDLTSVSVRTQLNAVDAGGGGGGGP